MIAMVQLLKVRDNFHRINFNFVEFKNEKMEKLENFQYFNKGDEEILPQIHFVIVKVDTINNFLRSIWNNQNMSNDIITNYLEQEINLFTNTSLNVALFLQFNLKIDIKQLNDILSSNQNDK